MNALATQGSWTLKHKTAMLGVCQEFSQAQSHSAITPSLYKLQRMMMLEGMEGDEPQIPIIIHESLRRQVSQKSIEECAESFQIIDPKFRQAFAIGVALISADLCRNIETASSTILQFYVSEEEAMEKLLALPDVFRGEQWAIRLRPFLSPNHQRIIEERLTILAPSAGQAPTQRLFNSLSQYLKLSFDQGIMPSQVTAKPWMSSIAKSVVSHLLCEERMEYQANAPLMRMLNGWIRQNILSLDAVPNPFRAAEHVKQLCPGLLHDPRNFPESWKKTLLVNTRDFGLGG